jgi:hypothetical protein
MSYEVKGILHVKGETQQRSEKFSTRPFTIKVMDDKYEQFITFELLNDRTDNGKAHKERSNILTHWKHGKCKAFFNCPKRWREYQGLDDSRNSLQAFQEIQGHSLGRGPCCQSIQDPQIPHWQECQ